MGHFRNQWNEGFRGVAAPLCSSSARGQVTATGKQRHFPLAALEQDAMLNKEGMISCKGKTSSGWHSCLSRRQPLGATGMNGYPSNAPGTAQMMGCDGDRVSGFPPYCQPGH